MKLGIVIPAHNEARTIRQVVKKIPRKLDGISQILPIVIDDGSSDDTLLVARESGAVALRHRINLGAGGATLTGLTATCRLGFDVAVTLDGDGQHDPNDIPTLLEAHQKDGADLVIGSRFLSKTIGEMPQLKWYGNKVMNRITYVFSHYNATDSQSGFRLFGPNFLELLHLFSTGGYEFCSEAIIIAHQSHLKIAEVPINTIYFDSRRGQNPLNGANIFLRLLYRSLTG